MTPEIDKLLNQYRTLWQSYVTSPGGDIQRQLIEAMEQIRVCAHLSDDEWSAFTTTLPGFDEWWLRVRGDYLDHLDGCAEAMEDE